MKIFKYFLIFIFGWGFSQNSELKNGDLIFQEGCAGAMSNAIKAVTDGTAEYDFTHVGMVWIDKHHNINVLEATVPKVSITPLQEYLFPKGKKCPPKSVVARLKPEYQQLIPKAIRFAKKKVGKNYDNAFDLKNDQYYCSELVYFALKKANKNREVFPLNIMTFKGLDGNFAPFWVEHFKKLNIEIPEGEPGINPNAMFRANVIENYWELN